MPQAASSILFVLLAPLIMTPAAADSHLDSHVPSCYVGIKTTSGDGCVAVTDSNTIATANCPQRSLHYCTTYAYRVTESGCTTEKVVTACTPNIDACDDPRTQWGSFDGFQCSTCNSEEDGNNCNPSDVVADTPSGAEQMAAPLMMLFGLLSMYWQFQ
mmetsp:Transcript_40704/g.95621  ORF Transcript_40704/g.95621 Transcript_40704/m.95621 type:complete len:158 (+) Transcript_40704:130-603(+)